MYCSARNLVRDVTGEQHLEAHNELLGANSQPTKLNVTTAAMRLFALLFLVKGIECCATSKVQGEHALAEVTHPYTNLIVAKTFTRTLLYRPCRTSRT